MNPRTLLSLLTLLCTAATQAAAPPTPKSPPPETAWAKRVIEVPALPSGVRFDELLADAFSEHAGVLGVPRERVEELVDVVDKHDDRIEISASPYKVPQAKPRAAEFLDAVVSTIESKLRDALSDRLGITRAVRDRDDAEHARRDARGQLDAFEQNIRRSTGRVDASIDAIRAAVPKLEEERQSLKLLMVGKEARQKAVAETINRLAKSAEAKVKDDPVAAELEKVVHAREVAWENLKALHAKGAASETEIRLGEEPIAEARARLLERRETVAQTGGGSGEILTSLNKELATLSIDVAESAARLNAIEETLKRYSEVQPMLGEAEDVRRDRDRFARELEAAQTALREKTAQVPDHILRVVKSESKTPGEMTPQNRAPAKP
jgi:predicted  nucleic acid-binding Zn-ribbon protein